MVWGRRAALTVCLCVGGLPEDETARTLIHNAHTHLLGNELCSLRRFQLPGGTLRTRPRTYVHAHTHPFICAQTYLPNTSAHWAPALAQKPLQRLHGQRQGHTTRGHTEPRKPAGVTFGHKHNPVPSGKSVSATVP